MLIKGYSNKEEVPLVENQATEEVCSLNAVTILFFFIIRVDVISILVH